MARDLVRRAAKVIAPALVIHTDIQVKKARGIYVEDVNGKTYMDFTSGLATVNTGHNHPSIVDAITKQAKSFIHSGSIFYYDGLVQLAEKLGKVTPPGLDNFFFSNSGAEVVEGAIKLARYATKRQGIIAFTGGFHGRTYGAASLTTSNIRYRRGYHPFLPSVYHTPYPYCYRCFMGKDGGCGMDCYIYLQRLFKNFIHPEEVACVIMEPVLGEGGYIVPPEGFIKKIKEICELHGILLILDEVQSGMGRTGKWFASEHFGVVPDIMTVAKGIASGMPLSAVVSSREIMSKWPPGAHGTTFGGNPVSCAAAIATIDAIQQERMLENAISVGAYALERLRLVQQKYPGICDVRGLGLMIGIEFVTENKEPDTQGVSRLLQYCLKKGLVLVESGLDKNIIRLAPPLIVKKREMEIGLDILEDAIKKTVVMRKK